LSTEANTVFKLTLDPHNKEGNTFSNILRVSK